MTLGKLFFILMRTIYIWLKNITIMYTKYNINTKYNKALYI